MEKVCGFFSVLFFPGALAANAVTCALTVRRPRWRPAVCTQFLGVAGIVARASRATALNIATPHAPSLAQLGGSWPALAVASSFT